MGTSLDLSAMNPVLKEYYKGQVVENLVYNDNPFLALVKKRTDFFGRNFPIPIISSPSAGRSSDFSTAQANQSPVQMQEFLLTRKRDYSIATIDNQTMMASSNDKGAFLNAIKVATDGAFRAATLSLASALFRAGTGTIGQSNAMTSGVITLLDPNSVVQFEVNMVLQAAATDGGTPRAALGYVISRDVTAGTVTVSATGIGGAAGSPASWSTTAAGDFLLVQGDSNAKISGLQAWLPATTPTSTPFYGVDRSTETWRLGGGRYTVGASQPIEEALVDASFLVGREGGKPDHAIMGFASYSAFIKSLSSKVQYIDIKGPAKVAFRGVEINGANSVIRVIPDRSCPGFTSYLLQMSSWNLMSLYEAPQIFHYHDGLDMLRINNQDTMELRVGYFANLACNAPGWNSFVLLGA